MAENKGSKIFALLVILISGIAIIKWKEYEEKVLEEYAQPPLDSVIKKIEPSPEIVSKISLLEKMALKIQSVLMV